MYQIFATDHSVNADLSSIIMYEGLRVGCWVENNGQNVQGKRQKKKKNKRKMGKKYEK